MYILNRNQNQTMKNTVKLLFIGILILTGCTKISVPNENARKIFGKWDFESNSGGFSGAGGSTKYCDDCWIEITDRGTFLIYDGNDKKISKSKFTIEMRKSIYDNEQHPAVVNKNGWSETFEVNDNALMLRDEAFDGYSYVFVKK